MLPWRVGRYLGNRKEEKPVAWAVLMESSVLEKKDESPPSPAGMYISKGYPVCDLLFMCIICPAVSLGNYFYFVHLIA